MILQPTPIVQRKGIEHAYEIATRYYSYAVLRWWLQTLITNFFGVNTL